MENSAVLADVSAYLINLLKNHCVPDAVQNADKIGLCSHNKTSDFALALVLYDIKPMDKGLFTGNVLPLCLRYALTTASQAIPEARALEEARILGKAVWVLANNPVIDRNILDNSGVTASIIMDGLSTDEKSKIFNPSDGIGCAAFYSVSPILVNIGGEPLAARVRSTR